MKILSTRSLLWLVGIAFALLLPLAARAERVPAWILLSPQDDDTVMTIGANEMDVLVKAGWHIEAAGSVETRQVPGSAVLHRLIRLKPPVVRMLESDTKELAKWRHAGYTEEGVLGHVAATPGADHIAVIQFTRGDQRMWLVRDASQKTAEEHGWTKQGVQFWLWPKEDVASAAPAPAAPAANTATEK